MLSVPRFIAVDDKQEHLGALLSSFQSIGVPCLGVKFDVATPVDRQHFSGVRCLFMDLHLTSGQVGTNHNKDFAIIQTILEESIHADGGPFVLVMWTEFPHLRDDLVAYLEKGFDPERPHARPLAVLQMSKNEFLADLTTGEVRHPQRLVNEIKSSILRNAQLAALLEWEADVMRAAGSTLASLIGLVPVQKRGLDTFSIELDTILSRLVKEAVGSAHVDASPRSAVSSALAPILSDKILNQEVTSESLAAWKTAVTLHDSRELPSASHLEAGAINRMLHVAVPGAEVLLPSDWGAVVAWPFDWNDATMESFTGLSRKQMFCQEFRLRSSAIARCRPVLVRVGAACDYAQNRHGPITYLFGAIIPDDAERQVRKISDDLPEVPVETSDAVWISPVLVMPEEKDTWRLYVNIRFPQIHLPAVSKGWRAIARIREQLLMHLINAASAHVARPGIVELRANR